MRFSVDISQQRMEWDELVRRVRLAESLGFEGAFGFDHFEPMYGEGPGNCFEGMTTLAALAGQTTTIRLGLLVTGVTYRHPSVLTAEAVTVDHASHGRLDLALGSAWHEPEHRALGIEFPPTGERFDRLEDTLEIVTRLTTGEEVSYEGHRFSLDRARMLPRPVQQPHPPIWIGGSGPRRTLPLVARYADVWHAFGAPDSLRDAGQRLDALAEEGGRDPRAIERAASLSISEPIDEVRATVERWREAGWSHLVCSWPSEGDPKVEEFAAAFLTETD